MSLLWICAALPFYLRPLLESLGIIEPEPPWSDGLNPVLLALPGLPVRGLAMPPLLTDERLCIPPLPERGVIPLTRLGVADCLIG